MVKNWMMLGDEAFDSNDKPIGVIHFTPEEMDNWQEVAWSRFANIVNHNNMVKEMVFSSNYLYLKGLFNRKAGVSLQDLSDFSRYFGKVLNNLEYGRTFIGYDSSPESNMLSLLFFNYVPEEHASLCLSEMMCLVGNILVPLRLQYNQMIS